MKKMLVVLVVASAILFVVDKTGAADLAGYKLYGNSIFVGKFLEGKALVTDAMGDSIQREVPKLPPDGKLVVRLRSSHTGTRNRNTALNQSRENAIRRELSRCNPLYNLDGRVFFETKIWTPGDPVDLHACWFDVYVPIGTHLTNDELANKMEEGFKSLNPLFNEIYTSLSRIEICLIGLGLGMLLAIILGIISLYKVKKNVKHIEDLAEFSLRSAEAIERMETNMEKLHKGVENRGLEILTKVGETKMDNLTYGLGISGNLNALVEATEKIVSWMCPTFEDWVEVGWEKEKWEIRIRKDGKTWTSPLEDLDHSNFISTNKKAVGKNIKMKFSFVTIPLEVTKLEVSSLRDQVPGLIAMGDMRKKK